MSGNGEASQFSLFAKYYKNVKYLLNKKGVIVCPFKGPGQMPGNGVASQ